MSKFHYSSNNISLCWDFFPSVYFDTHLRKRINTLCLFVINLILKYLTVFNCLHLANIHEDGKQLLNNNEHIFRRLLQITQRSNAYDKTL